MPGLITERNFPTSWTIKRFKYCAQICNGGEYSDIEVEEGGYPVIGSGGEFARASKFSYCGKSVLLGRKGTVDKPLFVDDAFWCVDTMFYTKIKDFMYEKYLYYCALCFPFDYYVTSTALPSMTQRDLGSQEIAVPQKKDQKAIADFLDKECAQIDSIAADLEKQVTLLQQYKKSLITETVTKGLDKSVPMKDSGVEFFGKIPAHWKVSKTKYVADISIGLVTTMTANYVDEDGVPLIRNSNIRTNHIDDNGMVYLSKEFAKANIGRALHKGDIVTVHTGDVGTSAIINETYHMSHGFATIISRLKTKTVNNQFLCWLYNSEIFKEMSIAYSTGDGRQNLNLYDFVDFYILIPTLKEQMEIVNWLNLKCTEIDNFIENKQQQLLLIQQHKKSLIYEYVTGKKRVKEVR